MQLSLLDLPIQDEPEPQPVAVPTPLTLSERHTLRWLQAKADYYLRLTNRFMDGKRCSQEVRTAEMVRVYEMREEILVAIYQLENRHQCNEQTPVTLTDAPAAPNQQAASNKTPSTEPSTAATTASSGGVG